MTGAEPDGDSPFAAWCHHRASGPVRELELERDADMLAAFEAGAAWAEWVENPVNLPAPPWLHARRS